MPERHANERHVVAEALQEKWRGGFRVTGPGPGEGPAEFLISLMALCWAQTAEACVQGLCSSGQIFNPEDKRKPPGVWWGGGCLKPGRCDKMQAGGGRAASGRGGGSRYLS